MCTSSTATRRRPASVNPACLLLLPRSVTRFLPQRESVTANCRLRKRVWRRNHAARMRRCRADCRRATGRPRAEELFKRRFIFLCALLCAALPIHAQRRPVLPQIDLPHPYYYRELYLPQLTSGPTSLAWAPNSNELVYSMAGSLWRQSLDSKEAAQLTDGPGYDFQPDWSPDGKSILYTSYQKDAMELWLLEVASGRATQLTTGRAVNLEP